jgi:hypothetical protein
MSAGTESGGCAGAVGTDRPPYRQEKRSRSQCTASTLREGVRRGAAIVRPVDGKYDGIPYRWFHRSEPMNRSGAHNMVRQRPARTISLCLQEQGRMQTGLYSWNMKTYAKNRGDASSGFEARGDSTQNGSHFRVCFRLEILRKVRVQNAEGPEIRAFYLPHKAHVLIAARQVSVSQQNPRLVSCRSILHSVARRLRTSPHDTPPPVLLGRMSLPVGPRC